MSEIPSGSHFPAPSRPPPPVRARESSELAPPLAERQLAAIKLDVPTPDEHSPGPNVLGVIPAASRDPSQAPARLTEDAPNTGHWRTSLVLFLLTVGSVSFVGGFFSFAVPLLAILLTHEFGHYIAARIHKVPASLPYFLPLPYLSPFGTLGAVIMMPDRIRSRRALLDIGAAGPIAGMVVALPLMILGLKLSTIEPALASGYVQEGQSLLYMFLKWLVLGPIPKGYDVILHPTAYAAWAGFFVTFYNLIPFAQLDGGHIAYALLGPRQNRWSRLLPWGVLALVLYNAWLYSMPAIRVAFKDGYSAIPSGMLLTATAPLTWVILLVLFKVLTRAAGPGHPPVDDETFDGVRRAIGIFTLLLFVLLFLPSPMVSF